MSNREKSLRSSIATYIRKSYVLASLSSSKSTSILPPTGFTNELYYCYMNSALQCILSINSLTLYFGTKKFKSWISLSSYEFCKAFSEVIITHQKPMQTYNAKIIKKLSSTIFDTSEQQVITFLITKEETKWEWYEKF